jgi:4-amino-4-deoxy-L-arabinose transferase-like glycosyltransferase
MGYNHRVQDGSPKGGSQSMNSVYSAGEQQGRLNRVMRVVSGLLLSCPADPSADKMNSGMRRLVTLFHGKFTWIGIFLLAFVLRAIFLLFFTDVWEQGIGDEGDYERIARHFAMTGEFMPLSSFRPPLFPLVLGIFYRLGGTLNLFLWLYVLLSAATAPMVAYGAARLFGHRVGVFAGLLCACDPHLIRQSVHLMTEPLFTLLYLAGGLCLFLGNVSLRPAAGVLWALATLCRPNLVGLCLIVALVGLWIERRQPKHLAMNLLSIFMFLLVLSPWVVRNYRVHEAFVPFVNNMGLNLWVGSGEGATGWYRGTFVTPHLPKVEVWRERFYLQDTIEFIIENTYQSFLLYLKKLLLFWRPYHHFVFQTYSVFTGLFALLGTILYWKVWLTRILIFNILYFKLSIAIFFVFVVGPRFTEPIFPILSVLAALGIDSLLRSWPRASRLAGSRTTTAE